MTRYLQGSLALLHFRKDRSFQRGKLRNLPNHSLVGSSLELYCSQFVELELEQDRSKRKALCTQYRRDLLQ